MAATADELVSVGVEIVTLALLEECRKIQSVLESKKKRRRRRWWVIPWIKRRQNFGASAQLLVELAAEDPETYRNHLRMSEVQFNFLLLKVAPLIQKADTFLRQALSAKLKLHITLHYLATGTCFGTLSALYRVPRCTISLTIPEVCSAIYKALDKFIQVPTTKEEWKQIIKDYYVTWNFPNCCGAMDGKHVVIRCPPKSGSDYFNYKKDFSIILFAIVDSNYNFLYIDVGTNGRTNDAAVFSKSVFNEALELNTLQIPENGLFVADDAFPLKTNILKPFPRIAALDQTKSVFNYRLSRARRVVENSFGILVARFCIFEKPIPLQVSTTEQIVKTTCALHNWLRQTSTNKNPYLERDLMDFEDTDRGTIIPGKWRLLKTDGLVDMSNRVSSNNYKRNAAAVRDYYAKLFVTTEIVPWQWNMI